MKHILVFWVVISLFITSCSPLDPDSKKSEPAENISMKMTSERNIDYDSMLFYKANTFKQLLRIGDGSLNIVDYNETYPFDSSDPVQLSIYTLGQAKEYHSIKLPDILPSNAHKRDQPKYPLAFFHIRDDESEPPTTHTFFLRHLTTASNQTELWLTCDSLDFQHKIDDTHSPGYPSLPISSYNKPFDYFNGWLTYAKDSNIYLINLYAELSILALKGEIKNLSGLDKNLKRTLPISLENYQSLKENRILQGVWDDAFQPRNRGDWKRLLHLHELEDYLLLSFPTRHQTEIIYIFEKQFSSAPSFIEFDYSQYRIYRGSNPPNDSPKILLFDSFLENIEIYDLANAQSFHLDASTFLTLSERAIDNAFLYSIGEKLCLLLFPTEFMSNQSNYIIALELDHQMKPSQKYKINLEENSLYHHLQVIHRHQESELALLSRNKESNQVVLFCITLENLQATVGYELYRLPFYDQGNRIDMTMFYASGGFFALQIRRYFHELRLETNYFNLNAIKNSENDPEELPET